MELRPAGDNANPIDLLEELVNSNDWIHNRSSDVEIMVQIGGQWCDYHICTVWEEQVGAVYFSCQMEARVPNRLHGKLRELLSHANERLWLGHFDMMPDDGLVLFRHTIPLRGRAGCSVEQLEDLVDTAILESERIYPALQMVAWGGYSVEDALAAALMETEGEA